MNLTQARRIDSLLAHPDQKIVECEMIFGGTLAMLHLLTPEGLDHPERLRLIRLQQNLSGNDSQGWRELAAQARTILTHLRSDYQQRCQTGT